MICITEIFPKNCLYGVTLAEFHIDGYDCFCSEFADHRRGVCIFIRSTFHAQRHEQLSDIQFQECLFCTLSLTNSDSVLVWVAYCSPNSSDANDSVLWQLINDTAEIASGSSHLLITVDFNLPKDFLVSAWWGFCSMFTSGSLG